MTVEIRLLGGFSVGRAEANGSLRAPRSAPARQVLSLLALGQGTSVSRAELIDALWYGRAPKDPEASLNVVIHRARKILGDADVLRTTPAGYQLLSPPVCVVDAEQARRLFEDGMGLLRAGRPVAARAAFEAALDWWRGDPLADDPDAPWAEAPRRELHLLRQETLEGASAAALAVDEAEAALRHARTAVGAAPLREQAHLLLVESLAASGDRAAALAAYSDMRARLVEELGIEPSPAAEALQQKVLRGAQPSVRMPIRQAMAFVGRDADLGSLASGLEVPGPAVIVLSAAAGFGKSRLLAELGERLDRPTIQGRAVLAELEEPWSLARSLAASALASAPEAASRLPARMRAAMTDLVPARDDVPDLVWSDPASWRALRGEGWLRLLADVVSDRSLLVVDDLQWADATSLQLLHRAIERLPLGGVLLALRPEEVLPGGEVAALLSNLEASVRLTVHELGPLDFAALFELVEDRELAQVLVDTTDGSPFAIREVLRSLTERGHVTPGRSGRWVVASPEAAALAATVAREGQRRIVRARLARQSPGLLYALALLGRPAQLTFLAEVCGLSRTEAALRMDALARADLVREEAPGWVPSHDLIAEAAREAMPATERAQVHDALATALDAHGGDTAEIAEHELAAGRQGAAHRFADAAAERLLAHASVEAKTLAERGLEIAEAQQARARLLEIRAEARAHLGDLPGARDDLRVALAIQTEPADRARVLSRLAMTTMGLGDLGYASRLADLALSAAGSETEARAHALNVAGIVDMNVGHAARARERADEAQGLFELLGDMRGVSQVLDGRAMAMFLDGDVAASVDAFGHAAALLEDVGDLIRAVTPRSTRGHALIFADHPSRALHGIDDALALATQLDFKEGEAYARWHRAEALAADGRSEAALEEASRALEVAREIGHRGWTATAWRAIGIAREASGDITGAIAAFAESLAAADQLPLFESWAASRLALARLAVGDVASAEPLVNRAKAVGPPLAHYEARLAEAALLFAVGSPGATDHTNTAIARAEAGGHLSSRRELERLLYASTERALPREIDHGLRVEQESPG